jgi:short-subunit dehydrogenase
MKEFRNILITGASSGIGMGLAREFAIRGYNVGMIARRTKELEDVARSLEVYPVKIAVATGDVTNSDEFEAAAARVVAEIGEIDIAIANAGIGGSMSFEKFDFDAAQRTYDVNVVGALRTFSTVLQPMLRKGAGQLVGVSSLASYGGFANQHPYCASKAALRIYMQGIGYELNPMGIITTCICPGYIKTPLTAKNSMKMPGLLELEPACRLMARAIIKKKSVYNFPKLFYSYARLREFLPKSLVLAIEPRKRVK